MRTCVSTSAWLAATLFLATSGACDLDVDGEVYSQEEPLTTTGDLNEVWDVYDAVDTPPPQWETYSSSNAGGEVLFKVGDCEVLSITETYNPGSFWGPDEERSGWARARGDCYSLCRSWSTSYFGYPGGGYRHTQYSKHDRPDGFRYRGAGYDVECRKSTLWGKWSGIPSWNQCPTPGWPGTITCT